MRNLDFTLGKYHQLCKAIIDSGYNTTTVRDYIANPPASDSYTVILRHDVDRKPEKAIHMATLEKMLGISSTYYFRATKAVFKEHIIKDIASLGHEIGYHYETLSKARGNYHKAVQLFQKELAHFRRIVPVSTICMHGNPLSKWDNRWLWGKYDFRQFHILGEAYLSIDYSQIMYLTDTGRSWNANITNIHDRVKSQLKSSVRTTDQLIQLVQSRAVPKICIQTHPERWDYKMSAWLKSCAYDMLSNCIKSILYQLTLQRRLGHKDSQIRL